MKNRIAKQPEILTTVRREGCPTPGESQAFFISERSEDMLKDWMKGFPKDVKRQMVFIDNVWEIARKEETDFFVVMHAVLELLGTGVTDQEILKQMFRESLDREKAMFAADPDAFHARLEGRLDAMLTARG